MYRRKSRPNGHTHGRLDYRCTRHDVERHGIPTDAQ